MTDRGKFKQFIDELQKAVEQGSLPRDTLKFARDMLIVGGDMINSQAIIGNNNVINYYPPTSTIEEKLELDEQALVADSLDAFRKEQFAEQSKASADPYPGLLAYQIRDANHFFGRESVIAELTAELQSRRVLWLHGRSGTGKSSLIQAGLMPALLKKNAFPILVRSFDESPTTALKKTLLKRHWSSNLKLGTESLLQFLSKLDIALNGQSIYLFFDQFEEFIIRLPESKQEEFARELAECVADASLPVHFIFSMRTDYFGETSILRERLQAGVGREYVVRSLKPDEARQVIVSPLEQLGITYQEGLVDTILNHLGTATVESPQLQLVCEKLFHSLPANSKQITFDHYQHLGETRGIITDYLKQVLHDQQVIPPGQYKAAMYILSTLVTLDGKRDMKHVSDWYTDERLRLLTVSWRANKEHSPVSDSPLSIDPSTAANFIEQVKKHVSVQGSDLHQIVENILNGYVLKSQRTFVDEVVRSLRDARLLHEIQSDDGELSYELIHDYLVAEVMGWLDEDEQNARQLRNKLNQKQLDFDRHKLLLEPKELEIISSQLGNPKLLLQDSDKRLLLLSAAAHGTGSQWLTVSGHNGLDWLREDCLDEGVPEVVRQGAAAFLGEVDDHQTFDKLVKAAEEEKRSSKKQSWSDLLAHYLNRSLKKKHLPPSLNRKMFFRLIHLAFVESTAARARMSRIVAYLVTICWFVYYVLNPFEDVNLYLRLGAGVVFLLLSIFFSNLFTQTMISLQRIARRWMLIWQVLSFTIVGSIAGIFLFLFMSGNWRIGFAGGLIGLALTQLKSGRGLWNMLRLFLITVCVFVLAFFVSGGDTFLEKLGSAFSAGIFSWFYIYFSERNESA